MMIGEMKRMSSTHNRFRATLLGLCLVAIASFSGANTASAQEVQITGPLAGAPAVHHMRIYRENRLMLVPHIGVTLRDSFQRNLMIGGQLHYHFLDWLGIGLWGSYGGVGFATELTREIEDLGTTSSTNRLSLPGRANFSQQLGQITWAAGPQINFIPLRGKLALFQKLFIDTDFYIQAGVVFLGIQERANVRAADCETAGDVGGCYLDSQTRRSNRVAVRPSFGVGLNAYINRFLGIQIEWRGFPAGINESGWDQAGADAKFPDGVINEHDRLSRLYHLVSLGFIVFLPPSQKISK